MLESDAVELRRRVSLQTAHATGQIERKRSCGMGYGYQTSIGRLALVGFEKILGGLRVRDDRVLVRQHGMSNSPLLRALVIAKRLRVEDSRKMAHRWLVVDHVVGSQPQPVGVVGLARSDALRTNDVSSGSHSKLAESGSKVNS